MKSNLHLKRPGSPVTYCGKPIDDSNQVFYFTLPLTHLSPVFKDLELCPECGLAHYDEIVRYLSGGVDAL